MLTEGLSILGWAESHCTHKASSSIETLQLKSNYKVHREAHQRGESCLENPGSPQRSPFDHECALYRRSDILDTVDENASEFENTETGKDIMICNSNDD